MPHFFATLRTFRTARSLLGDCRGVTALEYALMATSIALFIMGAVYAAGAHISSWYVTLAAANW